MDITSEQKPPRVRLHEWIKASAYSKGDFAAAVGIVPSSLTRILTGETERPSGPTMHLIQVRTGNAIKVADWFND